MQTEIKKSVAALLAYIIQKDNRDIKKEAPLFCEILGVDFNCTHDEALELLNEALSQEIVLSEHIDIINNALHDDKISKMHLLEHLNHIIYSDTISPKDYEEFEYIKNRLFEHN